MNLPPALLRPGVRQLRRHVLNPALPWATQRTRLDKFAQASPPPRGAKVTNRDVGGIQAEVVTARPGSVAGTVVHFHGGGYCVGSAAMARGWGAVVSAKTGCQVLLPDYRLAPEHPHPAALDDARLVLTALASEATTGPVVVSGDSAGGGLALALLLALRDEGQSMPAAASCCRRGSICPSTGTPTGTWYVRTSCSTRIGWPNAPARTPDQRQGPPRRSRRCWPTCTACHRCWSRPAPMSCSPLTPSGWPPKHRKPASMSAIPAGRAYGMTSRCSQACSRPPTARPIRPPGLSSR